MRTVRPGILGATLCLLLLGAAWAAPEFPELTGRVVDQAGILSPAVEESLSDDLRRYEAETTNQVTVVILESLQGYDITDYGYQLGRHWGIGQEGKDNGVLLIVAPAERKVRIEVGYGLEGALTDAIAKSIIEKRIVPRFKGGDFEDGIRAGVAAILGVLRGEPGLEADEAGDQDELGFLGRILVIVLVLGFVAIWSVASYFSSPRSWGGTYYGGRGGLSRGGGFRGGGFGGGGFGGGGGGFGGGGASGGW